MILQPVTGVAIAQVAGLPMTTPWLFWAWTLYGIAGIYWLPVVRLQIGMRDQSQAALATGNPLPAGYQHLRRIWF